jgi:hypothetical protein
MNRLNGLSVVVSTSSMLLANTQCIDDLYLNE